MCAGDSGRSAKSAANAGISLAKVVEARSPAAPRRPTTAPGVRVMTVKTKK
jgi:hypothetical protein